MVANGLGYSILNFPLKSTHTVDGSQYTIQPNKEKLLPLNLGIARLASVHPRQVVHRFAYFCATAIRRNGAWAGAAGRLT
jgi:hypothetical protein